MAEKSGRIDWKKKLEAMKQASSSKPHQSVPLPPEPPALEALTYEPEPEAVQAVQEVRPEVRESIKPVEVSQEAPVFLPDPQAGRIDRLEQQIRSLKVMGIAATFLAITALLGLAYTIKRGPERDPGISAATLTVHDPEGRGRAWLGEREGQVRFEFRDQAGKPRLSLGLDAQGDPKLTFYDKDRKVLGEIVPLPDGQPGIKLLNPGSEPVAAVPAPSSPVPNPQAIAPLPPPVLQPAVVPQEASQSGDKSTGQSGEPSKAEPAAWFVASPGGKAYHLSNCSWVNKLPPDQLRQFSSAAEAAKAGFHPCRRCRPDLKH